MARVLALETKENTISELKKLFESKKMIINTDYQRSSIWKVSQKQALIDSIIGGYPIGVLVTWENRNSEKEILDGQQRVNAIVEFLNDKFPFNEKKFSELSTSQQSKIQAYDVYSLELASHLTSDQVSTTFVRLQEGTPLSTAEKVYAFTGNYRNTFVSTFYEKQDIFFSKISDKRYRARLVAAHFLAIELKTNFDKNIFPDIAYPDLKAINEEYKIKSIPNSILRRYSDNIEFLGTYLHSVFGAIRIRELTPAYLLISYLRQSGAVTKPYQGFIFKDFMIELLSDLEKFSIYDDEPPTGMPRAVFGVLTKYKEYSRQGLSSGALQNLFEIIKSEFERRTGKITYKDKTRFFTRDQKISLYFKQKGKCEYCKNDIDLRYVDADHVKRHTEGGETELENGRLIHKKCHQIINRQGK